MLHLSCNGKGECALSYHRHENEAPVRLGRLFILAGGISVVMFLFFGVLYNTQIIHHEEYLSQSTRSIVRTETIKASRGIVTDRNGVTLISNASAYDLTFDPALLKKDEDQNTAILKLLQLFESQGRSWTDTLPISKEEPFSFTVDAISKEQKRRLLRYLTNLKVSREFIGEYLLNHRSLVDTTDLEEAAAEAAERAAQEPEDFKGKIKKLLKGNPNTSGVYVPDKKTLMERLSPDLLTSELLADAAVTPELVLDWMRADMEIPEEFSPADARKVLGIRYELKQRQTLGDNSSFILTENIDTPFISMLSDGNFVGVKVVNSSVRKYETDRAAHILGNVSRLFQEDLENPLYKDYPLDSIIGRSGVESAFEQYLQGKNGRRVLSVNEEGKVTGEYYSRTPQPGATVELTIDLDFQAKVEDALEAGVEGMNAQDGSDTRGAGVAVVKVGTGEILAMASYPTFKATDYYDTKKYNSLSDNPAKPLINRATMSAYPPGSTLKPATAIAALQSGKISLTERYYDGGRWTYPGANAYANCWHEAGHGRQTISQAITNSCNVFFAEMGYRMGLNTLNFWLEQFGLGEHTGIETGDTAGQRATNPVGQDQAPWAAFGQSNQIYTPLQLSNYVATLVSNGKHCKAHLLKAVKSYDNSEVLAVGDTNPVNVIEIAPANLKAVKTGMRNLVLSSLDRYFQNCIVDAGAKTGTAQLGRGITNNGVFICFAPYEEPEIAIGMVIERGGSGAALASTAVNIINAYFEKEPTYAVITGENQLLP
ncbi:MAG: penicillin-binding protein A [Oscillibacter sp.]|nr:penicillin-binding protein A [Oscillibacter sp.]